MIISNMPMIVHEACLTDNVKRILKLVNVDIPSNIYTFKDRTQYEHLLQQLTAENKKYSSNIYMVNIYVKMKNMQFINLNL